MKKLIALMITVAASFASAADLNGTWEGTGKASDSSGAQVACEVMKFQLEQTAEYVLVNEGYYKCGEAAEVKWEQSGALISGDKLVDQDGNQVGTVTADGIKIALAADGYKYEASFAVKGTTLNFNELTQTTDGSQWVRFEGSLQKK